MHVSRALGISEERMVFIEEVSKNQNNGIKHKECTVIPVWPSTRTKRQSVVPTVFPIENKGWFANLENVEPDEAYVVLIENGVCCAIENGRYITGQGALIYDLAKEHHLHFEIPYTEQRIYCPHVHLRGITVALLHKDATTNFSHWLCDLLPQVNLLKERFDLAKIDNFLVFHSRKSYQLESLEELGIPRTKVVRARPKQHYASDMLVVPSLFRYQNQCKLPQTIDFIRSYLPSPRSCVQPKRKLFLGRSDATFRFLKQENELFEKLQDKGFEYITFAGKSIRETAAIMSTASEVVGVFGSAMMYTVFCDPGTYVFDIANPNFYNAHHFHIANECDLHYHVYFGNHGTPLSEPIRLTEDISIDTSDFLTFYESGLAQH